MSEVSFVPRAEMAEYEWDKQRQDWIRPEVDRATLKELSQRNTMDGLLRIAFFVALLAGSAYATFLVARINLWLAIPVLYLYYFFYGFWVAIGHELQHQTVFGKAANWFSEIVFFFVQAMIWNSPRYARVSHRLHHRYTMIRGLDPETDWPMVITREWLRTFLRTLILKVLVVGAVVDLAKMFLLQIRRILGQKTWMMTDHCTDRDNRAIRIESAGILVFHLAVISVSIVFRRWELLAFVTIAWQIGSPMEGIWHATKHIGRPYNVKDHRLNTRSVKVSPFIKLIFWGLDDHIDHHLYPVVPSRNLPKLHEILKNRLPEPNNVMDCWTEMFATAREKEIDPAVEFFSVGKSSGSVAKGGLP